jgi:hypothetical protein
MGFLLWFIGFILAVFGFMGMAALQPAMMNFWLSAAFSSVGVWIAATMLACFFNDKFLHALSGDM